MKLMLPIFIMVAKHETQGICKHSILISGCAIMVTDYMKSRENLTDLVGHVAVHYCTLDMYDS